LARMHADQWEAEVLDLPWLVRPTQYMSMLDSRALDDAEERGFEHPIFERVRRGWTIAFERAPAGVAALLRTPAAELARRCDGLPRTLLHGDAKVANFALM